MRTKLTVEERFWAKVDKNGPVSDCRPDLGPCWVWTASRFRSGYGQFHVDTSHRGGSPSTHAHRIGYQLQTGDLPDNPLDHLCRVRACVRATHLEPVTTHINLLRGNGWSGRNARKTHCPQGHEYTPENTERRGNGRYCIPCNAEYDRRWRANNREHINRKERAAYARRKEAQRDAA